MQTMNDYLKHWVPHPEAYYWTAPIGCAENVLVKYNRELKVRTFSEEKAFIAVYTVNEKHIQALSPEMVQAGRYSADPYNGQGDISSVTDKEL